MNVLQKLKKAERRDHALRKRETRLHVIQAAAPPITRWWWRLRWKVVNAASLEAQQDHYAVRRHARRLGLLDHRTNRT